MRDPVLRGQEGAVEDFARVAAGEVSRFGDGVEDLESCCAMDREVVDGFVGDGFVGNKGRFGEHGGDGFGVRVCKRPALKNPKG